MNNCQISVIMPLFNDAPYVKAAIESVIAQTYSDWELIVVDDGSSDGSYEIAKAYESDRIKVFSQENSGACVARNHAIEKTSGTFIKFLDADDILDKNCLSAQITEMASLCEHEIPFGDYNFINSAGQIIYNHIFSWKEELDCNQELFFYTHWEVLISSPLHRRKLLEDIGLFDERLPRGQEYDLHFRLANNGCRFVYFPTPTFSYRKHDSVYRISTITKKRNYETSSYLAYTYLKFEDLLIKKHGELPYPFKSSLFKFWFKRSREAFASKKKDDGNFCLKKAESMLCEKHTFFQIYSMLGKIIGFIPLEAILRFRVKILGKNKKVHKEGLSLYI